MPVRPSHPAYRADRPSEGVQHERAHGAAVPGGHYIAANASNPESTSEFSACWEVVGPAFTPTPTPPVGLTLRHGDNNCDGSVDLVDALGTLRHIAGMPALPAPSGCPQIGGALPASAPNGIPGGGLVWGDIDCSGEVDVVDALRILRHIAALPPLPVPPGCPLLGDLLV